MGMAGIWEWAGVWWEQLGSVPTPRLTVKDLLGTCLCPGHKLGAGGTMVSTGQGPYAGINDSPGAVVCKPRGRGSVTSSEATVPWGLSKGVSQQKWLGMGEEQWSGRLVTGQLFKVPCHTSVGIRWKFQSRPRSTVASKSPGA